MIGLVHLNSLPSTPPLPLCSVFPQPGTERHSYSTKWVCHLSQQLWRETDDERESRKMQGGVEEKAVRNSWQATAHMWEEHRKKGKLIQRKG